MFPKLTEEWSNFLKHINFYFFQHRRLYLQWSNNIVPNFSDKSAFNVKTEHTLTLTLTKINFLIALAIFKFTLLFRINASWDFYSTVCYFLNIYISGLYLSNKLYPNKWIDEFNAIPLSFLSFTVTYQNSLKIVPAKSSRQRDFPQCDLKLPPNCQDRHLS